MFLYFPLFGVLQILLFVCFFQLSLCCMLYFLVHTSFLQRPLYGILQLFAGTSLFQRPLCHSFHILTDMSLFKQPLCHALQLFSCYFFLYGPLRITHKLFLLSGINIWKGLHHFYYLPLRSLTQYFTMLEVHSHLLSALGYHLDIKFIILFLIPKRLYNHHVAMCLILFPLFQQVKTIFGNVL